MKTKRTRLLDAEVELYRAITSPLKGRKEIGDALCAVIANAQLAANNTRGIEVSRGHQSPRDQQWWNAFEREVCQMIARGGDLNGTWRIVKEEILQVAEVEIDDLAVVTAAYTEIAAKQQVA